MGMQPESQNEECAAGSTKSPKLRRQSEDGETKPKMLRSVGSGPGRKSRACKLFSNSQRDREADS